VSNIPCDILTVYIIILLLRAVFSWFPPSNAGGAATAFRVLMDLTEPVLAPLRRVIPPAGMFDLSFTVLFIFLLIVRSAIGC
jgi:YggT family protein